VSVAIRKVDGVASVEVSLTNGIAKVQLKPDNRVRLAALRDTIEKNGFTPKEARIVAAGNVIGSPAGVGFQITGSDEMFAVDAGREMRAQIGQHATIEGIIQPASDAKGVSRLQVTKKLPVSE
jgi:copper chaperone CopZ